MPAATVFPRRIRAIRRTIFFSLVILTTVAALAMIASTLKPNRITPQELLMLFH
jgi:hypothetical protein